MKSVLESIPRSVRAEAERKLQGREQQRAWELSHDEHLISHAPGTTPERTARELAARHLRHHEANFQDKVATWTPLVQKYAPQSLDRLRDELLGEIPLDANIAPEQMHRFLHDRMKTFERYLTEDSPSRARGVRTVQRRRRKRSDKKSRRSESKSKW